MWFPVLICRLNIVHGHGYLGLPTCLSSRDSACQRRRPGFYSWGWAQTSLGETQPAPQGGGCAPATDSAFLSPRSHAPPTPPGSPPGQTGGRQLAGRSGRGWAGEQYEARPAVRALLRCHSRAHRARHQGGGEVRPGGGGGPPAPAPRRRVKYRAGP